MAIDTQFDVFEDTPPGKDPDKFSQTLRRYHRLLWSKPLPDGALFTLTNEPGGYLYHRSEMGEFQLSSDAISNTYQHVERMKTITMQISRQEIDSFYKLGSTIGAFILFPRKMIDKKQNINQARGCHPKIRDRIDLTLECIRCLFVGQSSPLSDTLERYRNFFAIFQSFDSYVDFFLLNDLVENDEVKFMLPFDNFQRDGYPSDASEYHAVMSNTMKFIRGRNQRIIAYYEKQKLQSLST